jgi:hypothetical protein
MWKIFWFEAPSIPQGGSFMYRFKPLRWFNSLRLFNGLRLIDSQDDEYLITPAGRHKKTAQIFQSNSQKIHQR